MKKKFAITLATLLSLACFAACGEDPQGSDSTAPAGSELRFEEILSDQQTRTLNADQATEYVVDEDISGKEYVKLEIKTDINLRGQFIYSDVNDPSKVVEEDFFIEASDGHTVVEFKQFLDRFRGEPSFGNFDKVMKKIRLKNVDGAQGSVTVCSLSVANRNVPEYEKEIYIQNGDLKVGADLACGGTLTYLERTNYNGEKICEYIDKDENVSIALESAMALDQSRFLSDSVNLINTPDPGRQFQQSYYANVGGLMGDTAAEVEQYGLSATVKPDDYGANGYDRGWATTAGDGGHYWPYNPVQGGNMANQVSQIIDYEVSENEIYVKVRAMDWAILDEPSKSYMENWYTIKDNMLYVTNRFIDWNGFTDMESVGAHSQELPAAYVVHPLNNYVCYVGDQPWTGDDNFDIQKELGFWGVTGGYKNRSHPEDWFAWVNDDLFGVGVYVPGIDTYVSGRVNPSTYMNYSGNSSAYKSILATDLLYNKKAPTSMWTSCYTHNTDYTAPVVNWKMRSYESIGYQYVIAVDYVPNMRNQFMKIYQGDDVKNEELGKWKL